jgi:hypothetical protein
MRWDKDYYFMFLGFLNANTIRITPKIMGVSR